MFSLDYFDSRVSVQGAYLLATNQRITARTKYFCVKWQFFWSHQVYHPTENPDGWIIVEKCDTKVQNDYLTKKGLPCEGYLSS
jgi:hypothetical protein